MVQITSFVYLLSAAAIAVATPSKRSVSTVLADIADISSKVTTLDNLITAYPLTGGTLSAALAIHQSTAPLIASLNTATADVLATGPVSVADGTSVLNAVQAFTPTIQHALTGIVTKRPAFLALPLGGVPALILQDLIFLRGNTTTFSNALIADAPSSLVAQATALKTTVITSFNTAVVAYGGTAA